MSVFCAVLSPVGRLLAILSGSLLLFLFTIPGVDAKEVYWGRKSQKVVVVDPGHGGNDSGAVGPQGTVEKDVALALARILARQLEKKYVIVLTRDGDYGLDLYRRTGLANQHNAALFLSIHTGAGFLAKASGITVFHLQEDAPGSYPADSDSIPEDWDELQYKHIPSSKGWARLLAARLAGTVRFSDSSIRSAPLAVLEGADMPSLLIEIGYLTNPNEENALQDPETLERIGLAIGDSIDDYFEKAEQ
jgi:N-acetylmuramoyl-L-alanine amidase